MKKVLVFALVVIVMSFFVDDAKASMCVDWGSCNYTSSSIDCMNGPCGPGYCQVAKVWLCTLSCMDFGTCYYMGENCYSCSPPCTPSCSSPYCGQPNGCGGTCSTSDIGNYSQTGYFCNSGCGTQACYNTYADPCGNWYWQQVGSVCNECGPYISAWSAWSSCSPTSFTRTRTRTCSEDCGTNDCAGVSLSQTENCRGTISGTFFDASAVNNCSTIASQPKIQGAGVTLTAQVNHSGVYETTTDVNGVYSRSDLLVPDSYNLTYLVDENLWVTSPPKLLCDGGLSGIALSTQGQTVTRRVGLYRIFGGWFQAQGGDISARDSIQETIPSTCVLPENQASCGSLDMGGTIYTPLVRDLGTDPGMVFSSSIDIFETANAITTSAGQSALSSYQGRVFDYGYYYAQTGILPRERWTDSSKPAASEAGTIYLSSGDVMIDSDWDMGGGGVDEKLFIIHDGNVTITSNINVEPGSYLGIVASGSITFASNVTQVEGVYLADSLNIASTGDELTEQQFVGEGTFVGWSSVSLNRDRGTTNNTAPSELFIFRPDFVIEAFDGVRLPEVRWQEVEG